jgi:beta-galactosidase
MWSFGNEAGFGNTFLEMRKTTLESDPERRLIQYADMNLSADFDSQTYPTIRWLKQHLAGKARRKGEQGQESHEHQHGEYPSGRPFVMNEYCHAMGNSLGNISDYWYLIYEQEMLAGGFVWDWIDQSLWKDPAEPAKGFVYGGDFGEFPNNKHFCVNGLIGADLKPHPHYEELQKVYQPVYFKLINKKPLTIEIKNHNLSLNTNAYYFRYEIIENGILTQEKILPDINCNPLETVQITLDDLSYNNRKEVFITLSFSLKDACQWAGKNYIVAWEQFQLSGYKPEALESFSDGKISLEENEIHYVIRGEKFKPIVAKSTGLISSYEYNQTEVITDEVHFNFWRALTDNDRGWKVDTKMGVWKKEASNYSVTHIARNDSKNGIVVIQSNLTFIKTNTSAKVKHTIQYC